MNNVNYNIPNYNLIFGNYIYKNKYKNIKLLQLFISNKENLKCWFRSYNSKEFYNIIIELINEFYYEDYIMIKEKQNNIAILFYQLLKYNKLTYEQQQTLISKYKIFDYIKKEYFSFIIMFLTKSIKCISLLNIIKTYDIKL